MPTQTDPPQKPVVHRPCDTGQDGPSTPGGRRRLPALVVPAEPTRTCRLALLQDTACAISDTIGGGLFDELLVGAVTDGRFVLYGADEPAALDDNPRAAALAARLGYEDRDLRRRLRGDVAVVGLDDAGSRDTDVPTGVLTAAAAGGLPIDTAGIRTGRGPAVLSPRT